MLVHHMKVEVHTREIQQLAIEKIVLNCEDTSNRC